jgi:hypothetical protein
MDKVQKPSDSGHQNLWGSICSFFQLQSGTSQSRNKTLSNFTQSHVIHISWHNGANYLSDSIWWFSKSTIRFAASLSLPSFASSLDTKFFFLLSPVIFEFCSIFLYSTFVDIVSINLTRMKNLSQYILDENSLFRNYLFQKWYVCGHRRVANVAKTWNVLEKML